MNPDQTPIRHDSQNSEEETLYTASSTLPPPASILRSQPVPDYPPETSSYQPARPDSDHPSIAASMSQYSSSSADDSVYSMPGPQSYQLVTPYDDRSMSQVSPGFIFVNFLSLDCFSAHLLFPCQFYGCQMSFLAIAWLFKAFRRFFFFLHTKSRTS